MKRILISILTIILLTNCSNPQKKQNETDIKLNVISEKNCDSAARQKDKENEETKKTTCVFTNPDTSVSGIRIRDVESVKIIVGKNTKLEGDSTHTFYSSDRKQVLKLTVHPGDYYSQVSVFSISYSKNSESKTRKLNINEFKTEKEIKLGLTKQQIIEKLGKCYVTKDSTNESIELFYRIELPNDSQTKLLERNNMPIYYASYKFRKDKLYNIEFGFEYP